MKLDEHEVEQRCRDEKRLRVLVVKRDMVNVWRID